MLVSRGCLLIPRIIQISPRYILFARSLRLLARTYVGCVFGKLPYRDKSQREGYRRYFSRRKNVGFTLQRKKNVVHVTPDAERQPVPHRFRKIARLRFIPLVFSLCFGYRCKPVKSDTLLKRL